MLKLSLLGRLSVSFDDETIESFVSAKSQALLCYLAVTAQPHTRHALAGLLWGDDPEEKAKNSLRVALANLRKLFPDSIDADRLLIGLVRDQPRWLDLEAFAALARTPELEQAASLLRGEFLQDFHVEDAPEFEEWLLTQRAYWLNQASLVLSTLAERYLTARRYADAAATLRRLLKFEPWHEAAHRRLMHALSHTGDLNAALAQYETCRRILLEELGVDPMPETTALHERIQSARLGQPYTLPAEEAPLVGREAELAQLHDLLINPDCRLITIAGLGGMGKTRLALAIAQQANREHALQFLNGVIFVSLAAVTSVDALPLALSAAFDLVLDERSEPDQQLLNFLKNKELLLVLDNFEHFIDGAELIARMLEATRDLKIIITSRTPLQLQSEWRIDLDGLTYPNTSETSEVLSHPAVQLFVQSAQKTRPSYVLSADDAPYVQQLCAFVAGMPLAIQLAAAWLRAMPIARIVDELQRNLDLLVSEIRDLSPRQRSMRAIFDYAWTQLTFEQRRFFAALSVFRGGFSEEAATQVAQGTPFLLAALVDRGLLQLGTRYEMHELTRQYAEEKRNKLEEQPRVGARPAENIEEAHARFYAQFVAQHASDLHNAQQLETYALLRQDLGNIRQAWAWAIAHTDADVIAICLDGVSDFYFSQSGFREGLSLLASARNALFGDNTSIDVLSLRLLLGEGRFHTLLAQYNDAQDRLASALRQAQQIEEPALIANALMLQSDLAHRQSDFDAAWQYATQALLLYEELKDRWGMAQACDILCITERDLSQYEKAREHGLFALDIFRQRGDQASLAKTLVNLGAIEIDIGHFDAAEAHYQEARTMLERSGQRWQLGRVVRNIGTVMMSLGEYDRAGQYYRESMLLAREIDDKSGVAKCVLNLSIQARSVDRLDEAHKLAQEASTSVENSTIVSAWRGP